MFSYYTGTPAHIIPSAGNLRFTPIAFLTARAAVESCLGMCISRCAQIQSPVDSAARHGQDDGLNSSKNTGASRIYFCPCSVFRWISIALMLTEHGGSKDGVSGIIVACSTWRVFYRQHLHRCLRISSVARAPARLSGWLAPGKKASAAATSWRFRRVRLWRFVCVRVFARGSSWRCVCMAAWCLRQERTL